MTMRFKLPPGGDVPPAVAARRLGLSSEQFKAALPHLQARTPPFPQADPDTGNYDLDAIDAWRRARYPQLYPQAAPLTLASNARDAKDVVRQRIARIGSG
jgi:hypothetical protein